MNDEFHRTPMGRKFFEADLPKLIEELMRIRKALERLAAALERPPTTH